MAVVVEYLTLTKEPYIISSVVEHFLLNLWKTHGDGIVLHRFPMLLVDDENLGPMPSLEDILQFRGVNGQNDAYVFMFEVFGVSVYGDDMVRDIINPDVSDRSPEETKEIRKKAMSQFTTSDEAFILAWTLKGRQAFKQLLYEKDPAWCQDNQINEAIDTSEVERYRYSSCQNKKSRGMNKDGLDRLEDLQEMVTADREARQDAFMEYLALQHQTRMGLHEREQEEPEQQPRRRRRLYSIESLV